MADSSSDEEMMLLLSAVLRRRRKKRRKRRKIWVKSIFQKRKEQGDYHKLLQEMRLSDPESHFRFLRMSKSSFDFILSKVLVLVFVKIM